MNQNHIFTPEEARVLTTLASLLSEATCDTYYWPDFMQKLDINTGTWESALGKLWSSNETAQFFNETLGAKLRALPHLTSRGDITVAKAFVIEAQ